MTCDWLLSIRNVFGLIHIIACISSSFCFMAEYYSIVWLYQSVFVRSSINGHLDRFQLLALRKNVAVSTCVHVFDWTPVFSSFGYVLRSGIAGSYDHSVFNLLMTDQTPRLLTLMWCLLWPLPHCSLGNPSDSWWPDCHYVMAGLATSVMTSEPLAPPLSSSRGTTLRRGPRGPRCCDCIWIDPIFQRVELSLGLWSRYFWKGKGVKPFCTDPLDSFCEGGAETWLIIITIFVSIIIFFVFKINRVVVCTWPKYKSQFGQLSGVWPWVSPVTSLTSSFLTRKIGIIIPLFARATEKI